ncbi:DUF4405 domain-containing protein [Methanofollis fontis]|nr:DUF4405 domain-containing protein [Methanofollis fontis]
MQKRQINAVVDLAMLVLFIIAAISSAVLLWLLPSGGGWGGGRAATALVDLDSVLGLTRSVWVDIHTIAGIIFIVLMLLHILLHIPYFRSIRRCLFPERNERCEVR